MELGLGERGKRMQWGRIMQGLQLELGAGSVGILSSKILLLVDAE